MNFLEAAGAQGTWGWGVTDRESSLGMKVHCCPLCSGHGHTPVGRSGGKRPPFSFLFFNFYCSALLKQNIVHNGVFSCLPTHFSFLHLLLRFQFPTMIIYFLSFHLPLVPLNHPEQSFQWEAAQPPQPFLTQRIRVWYRSGSSILTLLGTHNLAESASLKSFH